MSLATADIPREFGELFDVYWAIGIGVWVLIFVLVVAFVLRFRARRGQEDELAGGASRKTSLELTYAGLIALVVAFLLSMTYSTMDGPGYRVTAQGVDDGAAVPDAELIDLTAARWRWRFDYVRHGISETGDEDRLPTLTVPEDRPVKLRMTSIDVIHAVWIPELRFKQDVFPGRTTTMTVAFAEPGFLRRGGECNQYCGLRHAYMEFHIRVLTAEAWRAWLAEEGAG